MRFSPQQPRVPGGSPGGGEFGTGGKGTKHGAGHGSGKGGAAKPAAAGSLAYDPAKKTGTGYASKNGDARVHQLQQALNRLGITDAAGKKLAPDGKLGPKTTAAVQTAQKRLGLPTNGVVTPALLSALTKAKTLPRSAAMVDMYERAPMSSASINDLPDSAFAYIEPGGSKDDSGRTTPRSLRHFPIHDAAHVRNALARAPQSPYGKQAMPKILAAAKKFGINAAGQTNSAEPDGMFRSVPFEMAPTGDGLTLEGYAAVYDSPTRIDSWEGRFDEVIHQGAFARSLAQRTPVLMFEHGKHPLIGTMPLGVITRTSEDAKGLYIEARLSDNWLVQPVRDAVRDGAVTGMSFRFTVPDGGEKLTRRSGDVPLRDLFHLDVPELGPVVFPAYAPTTATVRSLAARLPDLGELRQAPPPEGDDDPATADAALDALLAPLGTADPQDAGGGRSTDLTGGSDARSADRGDPDTQPGNGAASPMHLRQRLDEGALRARGIK